MQKKILEEFTDMRDRYRDAGGVEEVEIGDGVSPLQQTKEIDLGAS